MGFSVQLVLMRGRPVDSMLTTWACTASARRHHRGPVLCAAPTWSGSFTLLFFDVTKREAPALEVCHGLPPLPSLPPSPGVDEADPFLLTLACLASAERIDAAYLQDSSISDCGQLIVPGHGTHWWNAESCDVERAAADTLLTTVFGPGAPDLDELDWGGGDTPYWARRLSR